METSFVLLRGRHGHKNAQLSFLPTVSLFSSALLLKCCHWVTLQLSLSTARRHTYLVSLYPSTHHLTTSFPHSPTPTLRAWHRTHTADPWLFDELRQPMQPISHCSPSILYHAAALLFPPLSHCSSLLAHKMLQGPQLTQNIPWAHFLLLCSDRAHTCAHMTMRMLPT